MYDRLVVKPLYWVSTKFDNVVEKLGVDRLVNAFGEVVVDGSNLARRLQTGNIGFYIFAMVISILAILATALIIK